MVKDILNLKGVQQLNRFQQRQINGGKKIKCIAGKHCQDIGIPPQN